MPNCRGESLRTAVIPPAEETTSSPLEMKPACREPDGSRDVPRDVPDGVALALKRTEYPEYGSHLDTRKGQVDSLREKKDLTSMQYREAGTDQHSKCGQGS